MSISIKDAHRELTRDLASVCDSDLYSDLQIRCGSRSFSVHKIIVSIRSPVFKQACADNRWKEGQDGVIVIGDALSSDNTDPCNDAVAVEQMIRYMYRGDYRLPHDIHLPSERESAIREPTGDDGSSDDSDSDDEDTSDEDDDDEVASETGKLSMSTGVLNLHAKIYVLGDKYLMPTLVKMAAQKFAKSGASLLWDDEAFCDAVTTIYNHTQAHDKTMKDIIAKMLTRHGQKGQLSNRLEAYIAATPELGLDLWKFCLPHRRLPYCPDCKSTTTIRTCPTDTEDDYDCAHYYFDCNCSMDVDLPFCPSCSKPNSCGYRVMWTRSQNVK